MPDHRIRLLHISDLHERGPRETSPFRRRRVLGAAWERNLDALAADGAFDLLCFTGDVADWGTDAEYAPVTEFLHATMERVAIPADRLFVIPGNHDVHRDPPAAEWGPLRKTLLEVDHLELSAWMAGGRAPRGIDAGLRDRILARGAAYRRWVGDTLGRKDLLPAGSPHGTLGYRRTLRLDGRPFDVHLVGLDSAWLAGDDHDSGKLLLTTEQVGRLTTDAAGRPLTGFRLGLVHHPLSDLADHADCQPLLADGVDLLLRGHLHREELSTVIDPARTLRHFAAGCLYEGHRADQWPNACHVIDAVLDEAGRPLRYELRFRGWSPRGHWHDDNGLYPGTRDGRLVLVVVPQAVTSAPPRDGIFVGREAELARLAEALLAPEGAPRRVALCALHGMPGVGKSYLADRFALVHAARFPGGYQKLVLVPGERREAASLLGELADRLGLPSGGAGVAVRVRERLLRPLTLLHVENADSRDAAAVAVRVAAQLAGCPLVVTGRYHFADGASGWTRVEMAPLDEATAVLQLETELGRPARDVAERDAFHRLARDLGRLPLALHLAAGHLRAGRTADGFLALLRKRQLDLAPNDLADAGLLADPTRALLRSTFDLSLDLLREHLADAVASAGVLFDGFAALGHAPVSASAAISAPPSPASNATTSRSWSWPRATCRSSPPSPPRSAPTTRGASTPSSARSSASRPRRTREGTGWRRGSSPDSRSPSPPRMAASNHGSSSRPRPRRSSPG